MKITKRLPSLRLFQALAISVYLKDVTALKQGLRILTNSFDEIEGEHILTLLVNSLSPYDRHWFGTLDGARKPIINTGKIQPMVLASDAPS